MNSLMQKGRILIIALVFVLGAIFGFRYFFNEMRSRSKASTGGQATLYMTSNYQAGTPAFTLTPKIKVNGLTVSAFELHIVYDSSKVELSDSSNFMNNITPPSGIIIADAQSGTEGSSGFKIVGTKTGSLNDDEPLVNIAFKIKAGSPVPYTFTWDSKTVVDTPNVEMQPLAVGANPTGSSSSSSPAGGAIIFESSSSYPLNASEIPVVLKISTGNQQVRPVDIVFTYSKDILTYQSLTVNSTIFNASNSIIIADPNTNRISLSTTAKNPVSGTVEVATVKFKPAKIGQGQLTLDLNNSTIYTALDNQNILTKSPTPAPYTITITANQTSSSSSSSSSQSSSTGGGGGTMGEITESNGDLLNVNATTFDQAPLRYEESIKLDSGDFILSASAKVYTNRGRGVLVVVACGQSDCGNGKRLNDPVATTPRFPISDKFQIQTTTFNINDAGKNKTYIVRLFVEDGSEADFDYVSLTNVWAGEQLTNPHFENVEKIISPRKHPDFWEMDDAGKIYGNVDLVRGDNNSLYINSSSRQ